jgi:NTE family protein
VRVPAGTVDAVLLRPIMTTWLVRARALLAVAALLTVEPLHAQATTPPDSSATPPTAEARGPRVGVVLSGGSAKALAHIGVLRTLEDVGVPVDVVTGTSMGAMIGGLYAIGYSAAGLETIATTLDWPFYFQDAPLRELLGIDRRLLGTRTIISFPIAHGRIGLPSGVVGGQRVSALLARLTWPAQTERDFRRFPIPFVAVATDLATGDAVVLDSGSLAASLRASMSIPGLFTPVTLGGRLLTDGGLARNLPARDARELGADMLICSDVSDPPASPAELRSLVGVLLQTITFQKYASTAEERPLCDVYVRPALEDIPSLAFDRAPEWVARGAAAARAALPELREIATRAGARRTPRWPGWTSTPSAPVRVTGLVVRGVSGQTERFVRRVLRLRSGTRVTPDDLETAVERVYATGLFQRITYRLNAAEPVPSTSSGSAADPAVVVVVDAEVADLDQLGFGVRFDDHYKASLLFTTELRNRLGFGSTTQVELRLGEQLRLGATFLRAGLLESRYAVGGTVSFTRTPIDIFGERQRIAESTVEVTSLGTLVGAAFGTSSLVGVRLKGEHASAVSSISPVDTSISQTFYSVAAVVRRESFDRVMYPSRGTSLYAKAELARGEARFTHYVVDARSVVRVAETVSLIGRAMLGDARGGREVPLHYRFFLGGVYASPLFPETQISFAGVRPQELSGAAVQRVGAAVQWEVRRGYFTTVRLDAGYAAEELRFALDAYRVGGALSVGAATPFGPLELSASGRTFGDRPRLELSLGLVF